MHFYFFFAPLIASIFYMVDEFEYQSLERFGYMAVSQRKIYFCGVFLRKPEGAEVLK